MGDGPIEGFQVILSNNGGEASRSLSPLQPNTVRAWHIIVRGTVTAHGQPVTLVANTVTFEDNSIIDNSGKPARLSYPPGSTPKAKTVVDDPGEGPNNGSNGGSGGDIRIFAVNITGVVRIKAQGASGGRGQDGGKGGPGRAYSGPPPAHIVVTNSVPPNPASGQPGGKGAPGGKAGSPGKSGDGGKLVIRMVDRGAPKPEIFSDLKGGEAPPFAAGGAGGDGGDGGSAPAYVTVRYGGGGGGPRMPERASRIETIVGYGRRGTTTVGDSAPSGRPGIPGLDGTVDFDFSSRADFAAACSATQLQFALQAAEVLYQNDEIDRATPILVWVESIGSLLEAGR